MEDLDLNFLNILINNKKETKDFLSQCNEEFFTSDLKRFAKHLFSYFKVYNSCPTLSTLIEFSTKGTNSNLEEYIIDVWNELDDHFTDAREYSFLLSKLKERKNLEFLELIKNTINSKEDISIVNKNINRYVNEIKALSSRKVYSEGSLRDEVDDYVERFKARQTNPEVAKGIFTGFSIFDHYSNGIRPTELGVVAADTGGGKSVFLINLAVNAYLGENKVPETNKELNRMIEEKDWKPAADVLLISLEMPKEEIEDRIVSCMAGINSLALMKGELVGTEESTKLSLALKFWKNYPGNLKIVDVPRGCSMAQVQSIFDDVCLEFRPQLVVIDYLGLMTDSNKDAEADWEKLKNVAEQMHEFCRVEEVATFTGVQVKTTKPGSDGIGLHRIGRSSMILHNVNIALQIECRENEDMRPDAPIHCIKFRRGPKFVMNNLRKEFQYNRFADLGLPSAGQEKETGKFGEDLSGLMESILNDNPEQEDEDNQED